MSEQNLDRTDPESEYLSYSALLHEMQSFLADDAPQNQLDNQTVSSAAQDNAASANLTILEQDLSADSSRSSESQDEKLVNPQIQLVAENAEETVFDGGMDAEPVDKTLQPATQTDAAEQLQLENDFRMFVQKTGKSLNNQSGEKTAARSSFEENEINNDNAVFAEINQFAPGSLETSFDEPETFLLANDKAGNDDSSQAAAWLGEMSYSEEISVNFDDFNNFDSLPLLLREDAKEIPLPDLILEETSKIESTPEINENFVQAPEFSEPVAAVAATIETTLRQSETVVATPQKSNKPTAIPLDLHERYIIFRLDHEFYAFSAANVAEIGHPVPITKLPFVPAWFLGIANLRGDILSVVGLREFWNKKSLAQQKAKMLILRSNQINLTIGVIVDSVREMRRVPTEEIELTESDSDNQISCKLGTADYDGQMLHLLDAEQLLASLKV